MTGGVDNTQTKIVSPKHPVDGRNKSVKTVGSPHDETIKTQSDMYPKGAYIPGTPLPKKGESKIIVLDYPEKTDLDGDHTIDSMSHAEQVSAFLPAGSYEIVGSDHDMSATAKKLRGIRERAENGENIGTVNMSVSTDGTTIAKLKMVTGIYDLTDKNIKEKSGEIIGKFRTQYEKDIALMNSNKLSPAEKQLIQRRIDDGKAILDVYDEIDKLSQASVPVVVAAGNSGPGYVNLFALNSKAIVTGARDATSQITDYTSNNSFVDLSVKEITAKNVKGKFDYNKDGKGEVPIKTYSSVEKTLKDNPGSTMKNFTMWGTSYTAPQVSKVAKWMHDQGISVDRMNEIFARTNEVIEKNPSKDWVKVAKKLAAKDIAARK